jgi:hypothetical protein
MNAMEGRKTGVEEVNEYHFYAYLVVNENEMKDMRDRLKPHRGQVYTE